MTDRASLPQSVGIVERDPFEVNHNLRAALSYAISVIESYQMDLRGAKGDVKPYPESQEIEGPNLEEQGFCQGTIYTNAIGTIHRIAKGDFTT